MKKDKLRIVLLGMMLAAFTLPVQADITGQTVYSIIIDNVNPSYSFFRIAPLCAYNPTVPGIQYCGANFVFDNSTAQGKSILSALLAAKATRNKITIVCNRCTSNPPTADFGGWGVTINQILLE